MFLLYSIHNYETIKQGKFNCELILTFTDFLRLA